MSIVQQLKSTVLSGMSNIYGLLITLFTLFIICIGLVTHLFLSKENIRKTTRNEQEGISANSMVFLLFVISFIHLIPFRSYALRYIIVFLVLKNLT